jgi:hypothetical protein
MRTSFGVTDYDLLSARSVLQRMPGRFQQLVMGFAATAVITASTGLAPAEPQRKDAPPKDTMPPIVFYVAKGEADACGVGCREWIAAEGTIDEQAPARLRGLLNRLGQRKLPIYFHSPGGLVAGGLGIGRLLRERRMTAGVARTIPRGCDPLQQQEAACDALKRGDRELLADLRTARTLCNSACVYALIGASVREVGAGARIGVHEIAHRRYDERGQPVPIDRKTLSAEQLKQLKAQEVRLATYIAEMGIDKALFEAAAQITHERIRYLSLDEIARFGIDRREFHESRWMVDEGPPGPLAVLKFVVEAKGGDKTNGKERQYRTTLIRLSCGRPGEIGVEYGRELASVDRPASIAVTSRSDGFVLAPRKSKPVLGYNDVQIEDRFARVPMAFFEDAAAGDVIEIRQAPDLAMPDKVSSLTRLSTRGLSEAIRVLGQRCRRA